MISGFLRDRPADRPPIGGSRLRGVARPVVHHPTACSAPVALSSERRGACFLSGEGAMRSGGGRSVPMVRGFLGDRPAKRSVIGVLKLRGATSPVLHHPTARFALVPTLSRRGGELGFVRRGGR